MGLMDSIKKKITGETDDAYDDDDYYNEFGGEDYTEDDNDYDQSKSQPNNTQSANSGIANSSPASIPQSPSPMGGISLSGAALEMKVVKPETFDSVPQIADHLLNKHTVVLNLENTNKETARRLIDFLSGVAYSIDGSLKKIASNAYVITPSNVDVGEAKLTKKAAPKQPEKPAETNTSDTFTNF